MSIACQVLELHCIYLESASNKQAEMVAHTYIVSKWRFAKLVKFHIETIEILSVLHLCIKYSS